MNIERFRQLCLHKPGVSEETPFGPHTLVFKVGGKIFALADLNLFDSVNLKCDPERAVELREYHEGIIPGYHMNKLHWISVDLNGGVPDVLFKELIDGSYEAVRRGLSRKEKIRLDALG